LFGGFGLGESFSGREALLSATIVRPQSDPLPCGCDSLTQIYLDEKKELPPHQLRMIAGVGTPLEVLQCVEQGIDLINTNYPCVVTELGQALNLSFLTDPSKVSSNSLMPPSSSL